MQAEVGAARHGCKTWAGSAAPSLKEREGTSHTAQETFMSDKEKPRQRRSHGDTWLPSGGIVADAIRAADVASGSANHDDGYRLRHAL